jgi:RHS repeat-associated protein
MPHLSRMSWNFKEELQATAQQVVAAGTPETTYYVYDSAGQRAGKITENANSLIIKAERIYVGGYELYKEASGLARETLHMMDDKNRIAMIDTRTKGNDDYEPVLTRYQLGNHLGSVSLELDDNARVIHYEQYHPYGTTAYQARNATIKAAAKRYRYTGMECDEETGLNYHSARYYAVWLGRWVSCDPIGIGGGMNIYNYGNNNPIFFLDKTGKQNTISNLWNRAVAGSRNISTRIHKAARYVGNKVQDAFNPFGNGIDA